MIIIIITIIKLAVIVVVVEIYNAENNAFIKCI
jgi:hypothetical protein